MFKKPENNDKLRANTGVSAVEEEISRKKRQSVGTDIGKQTVSLPETSLAIHKAKNEVITFF